MSVVHLGKDAMEAKDTTANGAQTQTDESDENDGVEWHRAEVALVQTIDRGPEGVAYQLHLVAPGRERRVLHADRVYVDGDRTFIGRSRIINDVVSVCVTDAPDGERNADVHLSDTAGGEVTADV
jgi:hypothetical protein